MGLREGVRDSSLALPFLFALRNPCDVGLYREAAFIARGAEVLRLG